MSVYGTHLQNKNPGLRVRQISAIESVMTSDDRPKFLGGDFNDHPGSNVLDIAYRFLDDPWSDGVGSGSPNTHPATHPKGRIDYVLYDGAQLTPEGIYVVDSTASDHRPVSSSFHLAGFHGQVCHRPPAEEPSGLEQPLAGGAVDP